MRERFFSVSFRKSRGMDQILNWPDIQPPDIRPFAKIYGRISDKTGYLDVFSAKLTLNIRPDTGY